LSERWWRRRKRKLTWLSDLRDESNQARVKDETRKPSEPYTFGFSVTLKPNTNPRLRKLETRLPSCSESEISEEPEPLIDVIEEDSEVVVVAELHGVKKEDIEIHATQCKLTLSIDTLQRKYYRELPLPDAVDPESALATIRNGILQVRLKKMMVDTHLLSR
jgi:HSP20 family protein